MIAAILTQALEYHRRGWSIIPVRRGSKIAAVRWTRYQENRADKQQLRRWFSPGKYENLAVVFGKVSRGLTCRDFDTMGEYDLWASRQTKLAQQLPTVRTANGTHVYFRGHYQTIMRIANGELRGSGGYCLLPPSVHPDGSIYQWINPLQNGNLLAITPEEAGFISETPLMKHVTESTETTEQTEHTEDIGVCKIVKSEEEVAIIRTLPKEESTRNRQIFEFARSIRTLYPEAKPQDFKVLVSQWHGRALPYINTKEFLETWIDFLQAWPKIKYLVGDEPIMKAFDRATTLDPPKIALEKYPDSKPLQVLSALCRELQAASGNNPFFLSTRTAGRLLGISHTHAARWLFLLEVDGIIETVCKGGTVETARKATRFKYIA